MKAVRSSRLFPLPRLPLTPGGLYDLSGGQAAAEGQDPSRQRRGNLLLEVRRVNGSFRRWGVGGLHRFVRTLFRPAQCAIPCNTPCAASTTVSRTRERRRMAAVSNFLLQLFEAPLSRFFAPAQAWASTAAGNEHSFSSLSEVDGRGENQFPSLPASLPPALQISFSPAQACSPHRSLAQTSFTTL